MKKVILYINQFFGQIGGEEAADHEPVLAEGPVGPGLALQPQLKDAQITHTVICGDDYMNEHTRQAMETIEGFLKDLEFDLLIAGPAFFAGRYGTNCGRICQFVQQRFHVPAITCMYRENPGVEMFRKDVYILEGGNSAAKMRKDLPKLARFANKLLAGDPILWAEEEGYFSRGVRAEVVLDRSRTADQRAFDMLMKKLKGEPYQTESPIEIPQKVPIAPPVKDPSKATYLFVSTGGVVPMGNPDHITTGTADHYGVYDLTGQDTLKAGEWESVHGGYDHAYANADPLTHIPLDAFRKLEQEGKIGGLYPKIFCTVGNLNSETNAVNMAREILKELQDQNISAIVLGSA